MKYARRLLAVLLCLLMVAAMLPMQVLAATDERYEEVNPSVPTTSPPCNHRESIVTIPATCTQPSQQICSCVICGQVIWVEYGSEPTGHLAGNYIIAASPTCTESGREEQRCVNCSALLDARDIPAAGHFAGPYALVKAPTCTEPGEEQQECLRCNSLLGTQSVPALGHEFGEWICIREPADGKAGLEERYCVRQDAKEQRQYIYDTSVGAVYYATNDPSDAHEDPSEPDTIAEHSATLIKYVFSSPENGMFYTPGETVEYGFELVNSGDVPLRSAAIFDDLLGGSVGSIGMLQPGECLRGSTMSYVVSEEDASSGLLTNQARAECVTEDGETITVSSNSITVPTGFVPFGVISGLSITKSEISTPANGSYYQAGETISYAITVTNDGETDLGETIIIDLLQSGSGEIGSAEMLHSGESRTVYFNWTVTDADVETGYVRNAALAEYDDGGSTQSAMSNFVISDTDGVLDITDGTSGFSTGSSTWFSTSSSASFSTGSSTWLSTGKVPGGIPGSIHVPLTLPGEGDNYRACAVEITGRGDTGAEYEMHYCTIHDETRQTIQTMVDSAKNDAARTKAWKFARSMWQTEIDELYEAMLEAADFEAALFVRYERRKFDAMLNAYEATLRRLNSEEGQIAMTMAELTMNKAVEMCYELHTAPEARLDSLLHTDSDYVGIECEDCFRPVAEKDDGSAAFALQLCPEHSITAQMRDALLESGQETAWENTLRLWRMDLQSAYAILRTCFDAEGKLTVDADFDAFNKWAEARQILLTILYPRDESTQLEILAYAFENRVMDLCNLMKG